MKTFSLLFAAAAALSSLSASASPSLIWGWCEDSTEDGPLPAGLYCNSAIGFPESLTQKFDGCYVTSILVCKGYYEEEPTIDLFLTKDNEVTNDWGGITLYTEEPFVSMTDVPFPGEEFDWVEFELPEPYLIVANEPFYAGWGYFNTNDNNRPLISDGVCNDNLATSWMEGYDPNDPWYGYWNNCGTAGANCIRLRISGDNLPSDDIVITGIEAPRAASPDTPMDIVLSVSNAASADINEIEVQYAFPGAEAHAITINGLSIAPGEKDTITLKDITAPYAGNVTLDINITSVNGKNDADPTNNMISATILCLPEGVGYERNIVVEEGTGTWCGNCPRGIVGMREMAEKYPERFIGIAAHSSDDMQIEAYQPYLNRYIDIVGYPYSTVDRVISGDPNFNELEANFLREAEVPAIAKVAIDEVSLMGDMIYVNPSVKFAVSEDNTEYGWAYVVTEDNVGPYVQVSYYTDGSLPGWDYTDPAVIMYYDEVAVAANNIMGINTIPASTEAEKEYSLPMTFDGTKVQNWENAHIIVMVINMKTGYVENAARKSLATVGVESISTDSAIRLQASNGMITLVSGEKADIFTLAGVKVGTLSAGEHMFVNNGIYLAKTNGKTYKLIVK